MNAGPKSVAKTHTIALMNQKGGVGKTTTTINLGAALVEQGANVLLIDMDPQAHLTLSVGLDPNVLDATIYDLLVDPEVEAAPIIQEVAENLWVLPAEVNLAGIESELVMEADRQHRLKNKLKQIVPLFDYVLIDCPPSLGLLTMNALALAGEVIVPMQSHFLALQGFSKLLETVQMIRQAVNPALKVSGVILCMHEKQTNLANEVMNDLENFFEAARRFPVPWSNAVLFQPPIRRNVKLAESPSFGQSIFEYSPWCPGARDYRKLAQCIADYHGFSVEEEEDEIEEEVTEMSSVEDVAEVAEVEALDSEVQTSPVTDEMTEPQKTENAENTELQDEPEQVVIDTTAETEHVSEEPAPEIVITAEAQNATEVNVNAEAPHESQSGESSSGPTQWYSVQPADDPSML